MVTCHPANFGKCRLVLSFFFDFSCHCVQGDVSHVKSMSPWCGNLGKGNISRVKYIFILLDSSLFHFYAHSLKSCNVAVLVLKKLRFFPLLIFFNQKLTFLIFCLFQSFFPLSNIPVHVIISGKNNN